MSRRVWTPRPYQGPAISHLLRHPRCALWATPGTGKTGVALTVLQALDMAGEGPALVLAPLRVARDTWSTEAAKWEHLAGLEVVPIVGTEKERRSALARTAPIYVTNYENLVWLIEYWGDRWPYRTVVADESDKIKGMRLSYRTAKKKDGTPGKTFLAGNGAKRADALARVAHLRTARFIELTGTPATNGLKDLWGQLWFLDRGHRLGRTYTDFTQRWFTRGFDGYGLEPLPGAEEQIHAAVADLCLSINAGDYFPLQDPVIVPRMVTLPPKARQLYRQMEYNFLAELNGRTATAANAAVKSLRLLQIASGAIYVDHEEDVVNPLARKDWELIHDAKIDALGDLISELQGANLIVVYHFYSDLMRLKKAFPKGRHLNTKQDEDDFKAGKIPLLFLHPASAGHGIDGFQTVCHHMAFFSHDWSLGNYLQVIERIGPTRQFQAGLDRNVFLYFILTEGTMDEEVMERRQSKKETLDILMEATKRRAAGLPSRWREQQEARETAEGML